MGGWVTRFSSAKLRALREARGLTQEDVAHRIGQRRTNYLLYESGRYKPRPNVLRAIAHVLDVEIDDLLTEGPIDIVYLRERRGLSQQDVAQKLSMSPTSLRRIERRQARIRRHQLMRLARILDVSPATLTRLLLVTND